MIVFNIIYCLAIIAFVAIVVYGMKEYKNVINNANDKAELYKNTIVEIETSIDSINKRLAHIEQLIANDINNRTKNSSSNTKKSNAKASDGQ